MIHFHGINTVLHKISLQRAYGRMTLTGVPKLCIFLNDGDQVLICARLDSLFL